MSTAADQLALNAEHMKMTAKTIEHYGIADADLPRIAAYLTNLTEHGQHLATLAGMIFETADPDHPLNTSPHGTNADAAIAHFANILDAAHEFATQTERELTLTASDHLANDT